ncbi:class I SAM-dependent methyltransferase [Nocardioides sp. TF02-7]|uniref:class I SAM-dependent methyltransferase n=1 Tax=Nocardioides sp. TF02-7 TaxID=2917724 RepID=UPI001F0689EA|nr:class I SAM-dependent methyltransferase [Nocardioides sp. TF02-7]UMG92503.1 class I SAM-dependent methyltransferase [Nocardioides sp. TF02-7]
MSGWWTDRVVPHLADRSLSSPQVAQLRREVCAGLTGTVLELGAGSGRNLPELPAAVTAVDVVEPSDVGWRMSEQRRDRAPFPVRRVGLDGQRVDAPDGSYDHVLCTFTLCTIPDPGRALSEVRRVLRPGGGFAFLEHGLAPTPRTAAWQRRLDPVQRRLAGGCHLSRDVPALVRDAGLDLVEVRSEYLPGPRTPWTFGHRGRAVRPTTPR